MWKYNDGGRADHFKGSARDCVVRAIAIATNQPYAKVYAELDQLRGKTARNGVEKSVYHPYLFKLGWRWIATMHFGSGCKMHLKSEELPKGRIITQCSKHLVAVIDGIINDTYDASRDGTRCVYGYYTKE
jgi:hypothetical protein